MIKIREIISFKILKIAFLVLQHFFKKTCYICVDNMYEKHASCIDTYSLFEYLRANKKEAYYLIWKENLSYKTKKTEGVITFNRQGDPDSSSYYFLKKTFWQLLKCKYVVSSFYGSLPTKYRSFLKNNKYIQLVGVGHGPVFLKTLVFDYPFCQEQEWDRYLVTNDEEKNIFLANGWPESKLILNGLPRYDCCVNTPHKQKKIFIFFTWRLTFEKERNSIYTSKYLNKLYKLLNNTELNIYIKKYDIKVVIGLHHALIDIVRMKVPNFPFEVADSTNLIEEINTSDLFITDYSSIFFDSAYLDHPCIFYRLDDKDRFLIDIDIQDRDNMKEKDSQLYNVFYEESQVIEKIKYYITNDFQLEKNNKSKMNKFFIQRKNNIPTFIETLEK
ncbi:MAG: CDP-glycerol glycerophosphotransferase family protein [Kiritimatiellae bacterium]|nr:CDP-glycerol glycerophosphotransferase family protein [Kiritimatiellia bacterium]